jgi:Fe2+ or Zn2+ uptake regulation protein
MRNTKQKNVILDIINNSYDHLTAYQIYDIARNKIPNISLGTVYRNLSNLVIENKIRKLEINGIDRFDRNIKHSHFICNKCEDIIDVDDSILLNNEYIDGNLVIDYDVKIKGICKKCIGGN